VYVCGKKDFRSQIITQTSETTLIEHQRSAFFAKTFLGFELIIQHLFVHILMKDIWAKSGKKRVKWFFCSWNQINVGGRPEPNSVLICEKFSTKGASHFTFSGYFIYGPSAVKLVVAVHGPSILKSNEHCFGLTCNVNHHLFFNQMFSPRKGTIG
jgi:hypothetical protein